jgi:hypothetical protein
MEVTVMLQNSSQWWYNLHVVRYSLLRLGRESITYCQVRLKTSSKAIRHRARFRHLGSSYRALASDDKSDSELVGVSPLRGEKEVWEKGEFATTGFAAGKASMPNVSGKLDLSGQHKQGYLLQPLHWCAGELQSGVTHVKEGSGSRPISVRSNC